MARAWLLDVLVRALIELGDHEAATLAVEESG